MERISGRRPVFGTRTIFPNDGSPAYSVVVGIRWACPHDRLAEAAAVVEGGFRAAPEDAVAQALYRLRIMTRGRAQDDAANREAEAVIWMEELRCYPGDIVLDVLKGWTKRQNGQWWPTWHEVQEALTLACDRRQALLNHVRVLLTDKPAEKPAAAEEPDDEARARVSAHWDDVRQMLSGDEPTKPAETKEQLEARLDAWAANPPRVVVGEELTKKLEQYRAAQ